MRPSLRRRRPNAAIQMLWIGPRLSTLERLSISSFLANGHEVDLYVYDELEGVPAGVRLCDAETVLPATKIFRYRETGSYAGFANFFRYKLLLAKGGWWVDTDVVCLRAFDFPAPYVFALEPGEEGSLVCNGIIKAPPGSRIMRRAWRTCRRSVPEELRWGETGSMLLERELTACSLREYLQEPAVFCPVHYSEWSVVLDAERSPDIPPSSYAIHLWHEMWRRSEQDADATYDENCLYESLKLRYL